jgi:hypothetical protein
MKVQIEVVSGSGGEALLINGFHLAGRMPKVGDRTIRQWMVDAKDIAKIVSPKADQKKYGCGGNGEPCSPPHCSGCPEAERKTP